MRNPPTTPTTKLPDSSPARVPGGASGVPQVGAAVPSNPAAAAFLGRGPGPIPKRYRVINGGMVMMTNVRTTMRAGKEISEKDYDIANLRRQGIKLEELVPEQPEAPAAPEETDAKPADAPAAT